jgi:tRNA threonylcarbamoyl adenosine modification protein YeaZ
VLVLAFDTSTPAVTVAIVDTDDSATQRVVGRSAGGGVVTFGTGPKTLAEHTEVANNRHGELLAPLIDHVLLEAGAKPRDLGAIAVGLGPGPFTGLRVGIVTAKAMGDALGVATYGECSLDIMASGAGGLAFDHETDQEHSFVVMSDARRKQVYWAGYDYYGNRVSDPDISEPRLLAETLDPTAYLAGAGANLYREVFSGFVVMTGHDFPSAAELGRNVADRLWREPPSDDLTPLYLRRPDAQPPGKLKAVTPA